MAMSENDIARAYCSLMQEARTRLEVIRHSGANAAKLPGPIVKEICYLQLRLLCEIVAVCCLVAQGNVASNNLAKTYEPRKIMAKLGTLNPYFYPIPINQTTVGRKTDGNRIINISSSDADHLSKKELLSLWDRCGDLLHRSPMIKAIKPQVVDDAVSADIGKWLNKILGLLNHHWITMIPNRKGLMASFASVESKNATISFLDFDPTNGQVQVRTTYLSIS